MKRKNKLVIYYYGYKKWIVLFLAGFLMGMILVYMKSSVFTGDNGIFNEASMNRLKYMKIENSDFLCYVMVKRIKGFLLLGLLSTTCIGMLVSYGAAAWQGIMTGMIIAAAVARFGIKGLLLVIISFFPHQLLLFPAGIMMLLWCHHNYSMFAYAGKKAWSVGNGRVHCMRQLGMLLWILAVVIIGCVLESYVNPLLISDIIKFF